jgi:uncharacterized protein YjbI with pentapeptide repeats
MQLDFSGQNLQGRNFKGQNLLGANFSYSDIRGANFTNANLTKANFSYVKTGNLSVMSIIFISFALFLAFFAGLLSGYSLSFLL